ncbi:Uncharacterized protein SCF082_LOCUS43037 [Durusdinium trenchii]|uniref:Uncharacterized protein n=1 Tax=Durusdinium trenchii TaxID=1381693 RepID=A0ABP0QSV0_9DINO
MDRIRKAIVWHVPMVCMLAHSRTNLAAKARVFLQTLGLLVSFREALIELCQSVVSIHTDYGTERGLARIADYPLDTLLPYLHCPEEAANIGAATLDKGDLFEDGSFDSNAGRDVEVFAVDAQPVSTNVSFESSLEGPDMMHIIHNATNNLGDVVSSYNFVLDALKPVCSLLSGKESKQQLIEMCFNTPETFPYQDQIGAFNVSVHEERWNTIACGIEEVDALEPALRNHWSLSRFLGKGEAECCDQSVPVPRPSDNASPDATGVNLKAVDDALCSDLWWGSLKTLIPIAKIQRKAVDFVNGCPCHATCHLDTKEMEDFCRSCPLRGRRCAELASGDFFTMLQELFDTSATLLELQLPRGLSQDEVSQLMKDFQLARQHLIMTYVMKLSFWQEAPHVLCGLSHWDPNVRVRCLTKALASNCSHPKVLWLKRPEARRCVAEFIAGGGLWRDDSQLDPLRELALELRLMFTSAWRVEGQHARTKKVSTHAHHHSAPYISLAHRLPEIKELLLTRPEVAGQLADFMGDVSNGCSAARQLGFSEKLLWECGWISTKTFEKRKAGFSVIYHDDPYCKYSLELPRGLKQKRVSVQDSDLASPDLSDGSVELKRALALQDVQKEVSNFDRGTFFTMKMNVRALATLQSMLSHKRQALELEPQSAVEWEMQAGQTPRAVAGLSDKLGLTVPLADLLEGVGDGLAHEFVVASVLHAHPNRFHRTQVEGESCLSGAWVVQLHSIVHVDVGGKQVLASLSPVTLGDGFCQHAPFVLQPRQLTLTELRSLRTWDAGDVVRRFDNQFMAQVPRVDQASVHTVVELLLRSPTGLVVRPDLSQDHINALDLLHASGPGEPLHEEATAYQLVVALEKSGWYHAVITNKKHKLLKKEKHAHERGGSEKMWFTVEGTVSVSRYYLLALAYLVGVIAGKDITEVPYGVPDAAYKALLGMESDKKTFEGRGMKRAFLHVSDDNWPEPKKRAATRKKKATAASSSKDKELCLEEKAADSCEGEGEGDDLAVELSSPSGLSSSGEEEITDCMDDAREAVSPKSNPAVESEVAAAPSRPEPKSVFRDEYGWNVDHKITKTCGIDPACQAVLVEASKRLDARQSCVFVDIVDQIHPAARSFCEGLLPNPDTATNTDYEQSHEQILAYLLNNSHWADQTAWCEAHQQYCVVNKPREKLGALVINNAGNCCQGWSSEGKRARKAHKSQYPLAVWLCQRKQLALDGQEDLFFQECTRHFDVESCLAGPLSSSHQVISLVVGPSELGWPTSRDRVLSAGISLRTLVWVGPTDPQKVEREFNYFFQRSCLLSGDVFFQEDEAVVQEWVDQKLLEKSHFGAKLSGERMWRKIFTPGQLQRLAAYRQLAPDHAGLDGTFICDLDHWPHSPGPDYGSFFPVLLRHGTIVNLNTKKIAMPRDRFLALGFHVSDKVSKKFRWPLADYVLSRSDRCVKSLTGNCQSLPCLLAWYLNLERREVCKVERPIKVELQQKEEKKINALQWLADE